MKNILVFNDEAHHCYREKPGAAEKGDERLFAHGRHRMRHSQTAPRPCGRQYPRRRDAHVRNLWEHICSEIRKYRPDFIVMVDDQPTPRLRQAGGRGDDDLLHLISEFNKMIAGIVKGAV